MWFTAQIRQQTEKSDIDRVLSALYRMEIRLLHQSRIPAHPGSGLLVLSAKKEDVNRKFINHPLFIICKRGKTCYNVKK